MDGYSCTDNSLKLNLEKQKSMLFLYCLLQFRNNKANTFNVLYLVAAYAVYRRYKTTSYFRPAIRRLMLQLWLNAPLRKVQSTNSSFFSLETKSCIVDKGVLYGRALEFCKGVYSESELLISKSVERKNSGGKLELLSIKNLILDLFEAAKMEQIYEAVSSSVKELSLIHISEPTRPY
eukprot:TRINITY_DN3584_c0_g11_i1.p1 TRINITY_DN3584_c0_g11~~TRINITY_DN3584_c0_g11_i1.p1  ORF type:complete len:178 (-),score=56.01 TRINITY_DN3584_c0_g11_i1:48-581(-)